MIQTYTFTSNTPGKSLLIFGAIHGDEICGPLAIQRIIKNIKSNKIVLNRGSITLIPICNPKAYNQKRRYIEEDLNRIFTPNRDSRSYESKLVENLIPYILSSDILLDIHSLSTKGQPFVFQDTQTTENLAIATGLPLRITGWAEMFKDHSKTNEGDTVTYALKHKKEAVVIECGQHQDTKAIDIAYQTILNIMSYANLISHDKQKQKIMTHIHLDKIYIKYKEGDLNEKWQHGDFVTKGTSIAKYSDGEDILAPEDGYILLPKHSPKINHEWFYFGKKIS